MYGCFCKTQYYMYVFLVLGKVMLLIVGTFF